MLELMMAQLKKMGFDPDVAKRQIEAAVGDIRAMKDSQDRTEKMVKAMLDRVLNIEETVRHLSWTEDDDRNAPVTKADVDKIMTVKTP